MSFRDSILTVVDQVRAITGPSGLDIRQNQLTIRKRTWAGGRIGAPGSAVHLYPPTTTFTIPAATDLPTAITLVNYLASSYELHRADTRAHQVVEQAAVSSPIATDLASAVLLCNEIQTLWNLHLADATVHYNADALNSSTSPAASDLASLVTLSNELRTRFTAHLALSAATDSDLVLPQKYRIRQLESKEIAGSGGAYESGDIIVEHITPSNGLIGYTPDELKPPIASDAEERLYIITGTHAGEYHLVQLRSWKPFSWDLIIGRRETTP